MQNPYIGEFKGVIHPVVLNKRDNTGRMIRLATPNQEVREAMEISLQPILINKGPAQLRNDQIFDQI